MTATKLNLPLLLVVILAVGCFGFFGFQRLTINTDMSRSLPTHEPVITDALEIFRNHPIHDQVAVDIAVDREAPEVLAASGAYVEEKMRQSGLFAEVGMGAIGALVPELAREIVAHLPLLFSPKELQDQVLPRLSEAAVDQRLRELIAGMGGLSGIGQAAFIGPDPLGLKDLVLAQLIHLAPSSRAQVQGGFLLSEDGRHLLVTARPVDAGSNTAVARQLADFFATAGRELAEQHAAAGVQVRLTPAGAFRAALDNEELIKHDVRLALGLSTAGIALLLIFSFPRPLVSLLFLIPPLAGTATALFVYSLFHSSISIMVLGFSGALISIMDDYSITYLLFLDRPQATRGTTAAREMQSIGGILALMTTIGSFLVLCWSDFPVFMELGQFTALGLTFTYLFLTFLCPRIFPVMPPSRERRLPVHGLVDALFSTGKTGLVGALLLAGVLLFFAKPVFRLSLSDMNTVSQKTQAEDRLFTSVWGDMGPKVYLMTTAATMEELQGKNDRLLARVEQDQLAGRLQSAFVPSTVFPGEERSRENRAAWRDFWTPALRAQVEATLTRSGARLGFTEEAFRPFLAQLAPDFTLEAAPLPERYTQLLGITAPKEGPLVQFTSLLPGKGYDPEAFQREYSSMGKIFDAEHFSTRLGNILFASFTSSLGWIAGVVTLLLLVYYLNWQLTALTLLPLGFAYICTLGTLKLLGHPLDIPALMLAVVIFGVGVDYTVYMVRGCQWYGSLNHPSHTLVRSAIFLSAASTMIGFGVLCFARHATLKSVGITSLCGIGYSLLGTFLLLPPLLRRYFRPEGSASAHGGTPEERVRHRYRLLEAYPRLFARFKLQYDPLFRELSPFLTRPGIVQTVLDIGCGYGVPACWCLELLPGATVIGVDPDGDRIRVADRAAGTRGQMHVGAAPDLPLSLPLVDAILLLDMSHYLDDHQLAATLLRGQSLLAPGGRLILRFVVQPPGRRSLPWYLEDFRVRIKGARARYRTPEDLTRMLKEAGLVAVECSAAMNPELFWIIGWNEGAGGQ